MCNAIKTVKKINLIVCILLNSICFSQSGRYFGKEISCAVSHTLNQFYWIDLKDDKTFEYNIFYLSKSTECKNLKGIWTISNDTIFLKTKDKTYYYLYSENRITSPDLNRDDRFYGSGKCINMGIDDFGLGIIEMINLEAILKDEKEKSWLKTIKYWSKKSCH